MVAAIFKVQAMQTNGEQIYHFMYNIEVLFFSKYFFQVVTYFMTFIFRIQKYQMCLKCYKMVLLISFTISCDKQTVILIFPIKVLTSLNLVLTLLAIDRKE